MNLRVFIGWDSKERLAWQVCAASLQACTRSPVAMEGVCATDLEAAGLYTRPHHEVGGVHWDDISNAPCSTDFAIARFWVPHLAGRAGWALFCDGDFLWRRDVRELLEFADPTKAVMVVPHQHSPTEQLKMDGQLQTTYPRKNWSSLVLWNLGHAGTHRLNAHMLNSLPGRDLHRFCWLEDHEIGFLPEAWNWLDGHSAKEIDPAAVHFTRGTPDMPGWEWTKYAPEWNRYAQAFMRRAA